MKVLRIPQAQMKISILIKKTGAFTKNFGRKKIRTNCNPILFRRNWKQLSEIVSAEVFPPKFQG